MEPVESFNELYNAYHKPLHAYFLGRTNDAEAALDLMQEAFARAWRHSGSVFGLEPDRQRWWLFQVARNLVTDHYRRSQSRRQQVELPAETAAPGAPENGPEASHERKEAVRALGAAIRDLPGGTPGRRWSCRPWAE